MKTTKTKYKFWFFKIKFLCQIALALSDPYSEFLCLSYHGLVKINSRSNTVLWKLLLIALAPGHTTRSGMSVEVWSLSLAWLNTAKLLSTELCLCLTSYM